MRAKVQILNELNINKHIDKLKVKCFYFRTTLILNVAGKQTIKFHKRSSWLANACKPDEIRLN